MCIMARNLDVEFNLHSILGVDVLGVCEVFYVYYVWVVQ